MQAGKRNNTESCKEKLDEKFLKNYCSEVWTRCFTMKTREG